MPRRNTRTEKNTLADGGPAPEGMGETPKIDPKEIEGKEGMITELGPKIKYVGKVNRLIKEDVIEIHDNPEVEGEMVEVVVKRAGEYERVLAEPHEIPTVIIDGTRKIELPSGEEQLAGFYHPDAVFLMNRYRSKFKRVVDKDGEPAAETPAADDVDASAADKNASGAAQGGEE